MIMVGHQAISVADSESSKKLIQSINKEMIISLWEKNRLFIYSSIIDVIDLTGSNRDNSCWHNKFYIRSKNPNTLLKTRSLVSTPGFCTRSRLLQTPGFKRIRKPVSRVSIFRFLQPNEFSANTGFQRTLATRCVEFTFCTWKRLELTPSFKDRRF